MKRRSGYTLVEVILVLTFGMILLGCGVRLLMLVFRLDRVEVARLSEETSQDRLARRFRDDVASATALRPPADLHPGRIELALPGGRRASYEIEKAALVRIETQGGKAIGREVYAAPNAFEPRFEYEKRGANDWVRLRWTRTAGSAQTQRRDQVPVEAALNRFGRGGKRGNDDSAN
jgi:hypothetical protein